MKKKRLTYIFFGLVILIVAIVLIAYWCKIFKCKVKDPNKTGDPLPDGSPTSTWIAEKPPYNVGMFGEKIRALQKVLKITEDGKFGNQTKAAIIAKGYSVPLSEPDYNKIIAGDVIGKAAYANADLVFVYLTDGSILKTVNKDALIGYVTGTTDKEYLIQGGLKVFKSTVYLK